MSVPLLVSTPEALPVTWDVPVPLVPVPAPLRSPETPSVAGDHRPGPVDTEASYARLTERVHETVAAGVEVPCVGPGGAAWTSDEYEDQQLAAERYLDCPLAAQCRAYALAAQETAGVWGGYVLNPARPPKRPRQRRPTGRAVEYLCADFRPDFLGAGAENPSSSHQSGGYPAMNTIKTTGSCNCQCGEATSPKAMYRPGHDYRHVSTLIGYLENDLADGKKVTAREIASLAKQLPSAPLRAKFTRAAQRFAAKVATKSEASGGEPA